MIAFSEVVSPLSVDVSDAVEMGIVAVVDLANDAPISVCLVRADCDWSVQANTLDRLAQEGSGSLCIPPCGKTFASATKARTLQRQIEG